MTQESKTRKGVGETEQRLPPERSSIEMIARLAQVNLDSASPFQPDAPINPKATDLLCANITKGVDTQRKTTWDAFDASQAIANPNWSTMSSQEKQKLRLKAYTDSQIAHSWPQIKDDADAKEALEALGLDLSGNDQEDAFRKFLSPSESGQEPTLYDQCFGKGKDTASEILKTLKEKSSSNGNLDEDKLIKHIDSLRILLTSLFGRNEASNALGAVTVLEIVNENWPESLTPANLKKLEKDNPDEFKLKDHERQALLYMEGKLPPIIPTFETSIATQTPSIPTPAAPALPKIDAQPPEPEVEPEPDIQELERVTGTIFTETEEGMYEGKLTLEDTDATIEIPEGAFAGFNLRPKSSPEDNIHTMIRLGKGMRLDLKTLNALASLGLLDDNTLTIVTNKFKEWKDNDELISLINEKASVSTSWSSSRDIFHETDRDREMHANFQETEKFLSQEEFEEFLQTFKENAERTTTPAPGLAPEPPIAVPTGLPSALPLGFPDLPGQTDIQPPVIPLVPPLSTEDSPETKMEELDSAIDSLIGTFPEDSRREMLEKAMARTDTQTQEMLRNNPTDITPQTIAELKLANLKSVFDESQQSNRFGEQTPEKLEAEVETGEKGKVKIEEEIIGKIHEPTSKYNGGNFVRLTLDGKKSDIVWRQQGSYRPIKGHYNAYPEDTAEILEPLNIPDGTRLQITSYKRGAPQITINGGKDATLSTEDLRYLKDNKWHLDLMTNESHLWVGFPDGAGGKARFVYRDQILRWDIDSYEHGLKDNISIREAFDLLKKSATSTVGIKPTEALDSSAPPTDKLEAEVAAKEQNLVQETPIAGTISSEMGTPLVALKIREKDIAGRWTKRREREWKLNASDNPDKSSLPESLDIPPGINIVLVGNENKQTGEHARIYIKGGEGARIDLPENFTTISLTEVEKQFVWQRLHGYPDSFKQAPEGSATTWDYVLKQEVIIPLEKVKDYWREQSAAKKLPPAPLPSVGEETNPTTEAQLVTLEERIKAAENTHMAAVRESIKTYDAIDQFLEGNDTYASAKKANKEARDTYKAALDKSGLAEEVFDVTPSGKELRETWVKSIFSEVDIRTSLLSASPGKELVENRKKLVEAQEDAEKSLEQAKAEATGQTPPAPPLEKLPPQLISLEGRTNLVEQLNSKLSENKAKNHLTFRTSADSLRNYFVSFAESQGAKVKEGIKIEIMKDNKIAVRGIEITKSKMLVSGKVNLDLILSNGLSGISVETQNYRQNAAASIFGGNIEAQIKAIDSIIKQLLKEKLLPANQSWTPQKLSIAGGNILIEFNKT